MFLCSDLQMYTGITATRAFQFVTSAHALRISKYTKKKSGLEFRRLIQYYLSSGFACSFFSDPSTLGKQNLWFRLK